MDTACTVGRHPGHERHGDPRHPTCGGRDQGRGCHREPRHRVRHGKAPGMWVSRGTPTHNTPWEGTHGTSVVGTPETHCMAGRPPGDTGVVGSRSRHKSWDTSPARRASGASPALGEASAQDALGPWGRGGGGRWLSPKQDVPLGAGDALRQPFAECPRLLHRPREEEEGRALGSVAPRAAQGRRPAGREGAGDGTGCGGVGRCGAVTAVTTRSSSCLQIGRDDPSPRHQTPKARVQPHVGVLSAEKPIAPVSALPAQPQPPPPAQGPWHLSPNPLSLPGPSGTEEPEQREDGPKGTPRKPGWREQGLAGLGDSTCCRDRVS